MIDVMKKLSEIAENYDNEDIQAGIVAAGKTHSVVAEETVQEGAVKDMMQDVEEGMTKAEFEKKYPGQDYDAIKKDIEEKMDESKEANVEEVHEDVESDETELDRMLYLGGVMGSSSNNIMIKENIEEASVEEAAQDGVVEIGYDANSTTFKTPYGEVTANYSSNSRAYDDFDADNNQLGDVLNNMDQHPSFDMSDGINHDNVEDYITMSVKKMSSMDEADVQEADVQDTASRIMSEVSLDEEELDEGTDRITDPEELNLYSDEEIKAAKSTSAEELKDELLTNIGYLMDQSKDPSFEKGPLPSDYIADHMGDFYANMHLMADDATLSCYETMRDMLNADPDALYQAGKKCLKILGAEASVEEGNEFSGALATAKKDGKAEFEVDGKKYKVEAMDSDEDAIQEDEGEDGDMPSKAHIEKMCKDGKSKKEICDMHPGCDQGKLKKMIDDCSEHMTEGGGRDMDCATCDGTGKDDDKECKSCEGSGEAQDDDSMNNESKVEETTSAGSVADGAGSGSSPYKNASVYESNEIVKRARQLNEDMSFTVSGGPDQEPTLNINASGAEAQQLGQLLKLSGLGMTPAAPHYGAMEIEVSEDQEFANSNQNEETADTNTLVNTISGGLNGQKKMAYPRASQGDNAMATLGESELVATSANQLMKQYQAFKTK